ncbi:peptide/nickel transport system substrate-binding protein [Actinoplanes octamycinicus]|uniref:Peptide/nickel transport system substrate-binding protein n=1 Tax=Actinoplanes octamycinicus TaxID=135948 RepID=A0A7W7H1K8_9ACTN|nr:ABC transporter substrate-binding protein [Actinoplanes octamycinicus]MBB4742124.1 peptide/nickel transport system substrate-binding protein [Actinoplanes octamycinicus]GIE60030.1 ABC transporter substrate-binding protein [Actinoplanes octamycinicus]
MNSNGVSRRDLLRYMGVLGAATTITAGLGACGGGDSGSSGSGSKTIEATLAFTLSSGFDPMNASSAVATAVNQHIFEALVDLDPITRKPYPALAAALPTPGADPLTWTVTLREGAKFSDGTPVTAEDVVWSFQRVLDPANKALMAGFVTFLDKVTATDAKTVVFTLKTPFSLFPQRIAVIKIVPKAKTGDPAAAKAFDTTPIGSGPFTLVSANATAGVVLGANANYGGSRKALVEKITLRTTPDNTARLNDLQGGSSQAIEAVPYLDVSAVSGGKKVDEKQAFNHLFLMFNCAAEPFDDKRVRQALHYAIDTDKLIRTAVQGHATAATSYLDEGNAGYQKAATVYHYDPDKAKALLAAAGASNLSFELVTTDAAFIKDSAPVIIDAWKAIGVTATLNTNPSSAVYGTIVPGDGFRVLAGSGDPSTFGPDVDLLLRWFYTNQTWTRDRHRWAGTPAAAQCAKLIEDAAKSTGATQTGLWKQALDLVADEVPIYPVFHAKTITAFDPAKLKDFQGAATTGLYFLGTSRG